MVVVNPAVLTMSRTLAITTAILFAALPATASPVERQIETQSFSDANGPLAQAVERLALRIMAMPTVKQAAAKGLQRYRTSPMGQKPDALRHVRPAIGEVAALASLYTAMGATADPAFVWVYAAPRRWHGYTVPGSRWYADNVDAIYRAFRVDPQSTYEITMQPGKELPSQLSFMLYDFLMYENGMNAQLDIPPGAFEVTDKTLRNSDGSITLTVGPEPANGRSNYLQLKPGVKQVFAREIRGDGSQPAVRLSVKRTKGGAPKPKAIEELAAEAATYVAAAVDGTINRHIVFGDPTENKLGPVRVRWIEGSGSPSQKLVTDEPLGPDKALGFLSSAQFNLKEDDALVMTLNMMGAKYLSVNTYRPFAVSPEHVTRTSSLNNLQAKPNPDGSFTFVLARKDPGLFNWIDPSGIPFGALAVRWQTLTHPVVGTLANGVKEVRVVKLADLRKELPPSTKWVTPSERAAQRAERARQFKLRCLGTPCEVGGKLDRMY